MFHAILVHKGPFNSIDECDLDTQNISNNPTTSLGPATSESNNLPRGSAFGKARGAKDFQLVEQSFLIGGDCVGTAAPTKAEMELLAQNRGNAMQRYKEKKKTRRYIFVWVFSFRSLTSIFLNI
jgi:hypothetical protein